MNKLYRSKIIEEIIIRERNINGIQDIDVLLEKLKQYKEVSYR